MYSNLFLDHALEHVPHVQHSGAIAHQQILVVLGPAECAHNGRHFALEDHHPRLDVHDIEHAIFTATYDHRAGPVESNNRNAVPMLQNQPVILGVYGAVLVGDLQLPQEQFSAGASDEYLQAVFGLERVQTDDLVL